MNFLNKDSSNRVEAKSSLFSSTQVTNNYNVNYDTTSTVIGAAAIVFGSIVLSRKLIPKPHPVPPNPGPTEEDSVFVTDLLPRYDVCCLLPQSPSTSDNVKLHLRRNLQHHFSNSNKCEEKILHGDYNFCQQGCNKFLFTDGSSLADDRVEARICVLYAEGIDKSVEEPLIDRIKMMRPQHIVICLKYGAKRFKDRLHQATSVRKLSMTMLRNKGPLTINIHNKDEIDQLDIDALLACLHEELEVISSSAPAAARHSPRDTPTTVTVHANLAKIKSLHGFQDNHKLQTLHYKVRDFAGKDKLQGLIWSKTKQKNCLGPHCFAIDGIDDTSVQAFGLSVCVGLVDYDWSNKKGGKCRNVYRIDSIESKEIFQDKIKDDADMKVVWVHNVTKVFESAEELKTWIETPVTYLLTVDTQTNEKEKTFIEELNYDGWLHDEVMQDSGVLHDNDSCHSLASRYQGVMKITCNSPDSIEPLRQSAADAICSDPKKISIFGDDDDNNSVWVQVDIASVEVLKRLLTFLHSNDTSIGEKANAGTLSIEDVTQLYEDAILRLHTPTQEQKTIIDKISRSESKYRRAHVKGAAGTGKTFIALHHALEYLRESWRRKHRKDRSRDVDESSRSSEVVFVCSTLALAYHFVRWVLVRTKKAHWNHYLENMTILVGEEEDAYRMSYREEQIRHRTRYYLDAGRKRSAPPDLTECGLVIVDEAHEVFGADVAASTQGENRKFREELLDHEKDCYRLLLLSDYSQSTSASKIAFPKVDHEENDEDEEFTLTKVSRCSKRIILAAKTFQMNKTATTSCEHDADGMKVKAILFKPPEEDELETLVEKYCSKVSEAIKHVREGGPFNGVDLSKNNRLALVFRDEKMKTNIMGHETFKKLLKEWKLEPISAVDAMREIPVPQNSYNSDHTDNEKDHVSTIICDDISAISGLEFLIVIAVGIDTSNRKDNGDLVSTQDQKNAQSMIFRCITRAHFYVVIVNEIIDDGWFSFIHCLVPASKDDSGATVGGLNLESEEKVINDTAATDLIAMETKKEKTISIQPKENWFFSFIQSLVSASNSVSSSTVNETKLTFDFKSAIDITETNVWDNDDTDKMRVKNATFNPVVGESPVLDEDRDLNGLCKRREWVKVRNYLKFSGDAVDVKLRRIIWKDDDGFNCLHWACGEDGAPPETVSVMIGIGGRSLVVAREDDGYTPLHIACVYGASLKVIKALVDVGGTELTLMKTNIGSTALHRLCYNTSRHDDCVGAARALLLRGGRQLLHIKDHVNGDTAIDIAKRNNAPSEFITYLSNY